MKTAILILGTLLGTQSALAQAEEAANSEDSTEATESPMESEDAQFESTGTEETATTTLQEDDTEAKPTTSPRNLEGRSISLLIPESAPLPARVFRFRTVYGSASSDTSYDGAGKKASATDGFELKASGLAFALEYGITDKISAQLLIPYSLGGDVSLKDEEKFKKRDDVRTSVENAVDAALASLESNLKSSFGAGWDANVATPSNILNPTTGEVLIPAGTPVQTGFNAVRNAAIETALETAVNTFKSTETSRTEGLGDVEIGVKYGLSTAQDPWFDTVNVFTSIAAGIRLNTGDYAGSTKEGDLPAGRGTTDFAIRLNADFEPLQGIQIQAENQTEIMLASGKGWTQPESAQGKEEDLERDGMRQIGYTALAVAPGAWLEPLRPLSFKVRFNWDNDPIVTIGDNEVSPLQVKRAIQSGVSLNGLEYRIPVQLDYDYIHALASPSTIFATNTHQVQLKLYYRF